MRPEFSVYIEPPATVRVSIGRLYGDAVRWLKVSGYCGMITDAA